MNLLAASFEASYYFSSQTAKDSAASCGVLYPGTLAGVSSAKYRRKIAG
jgi:hypothetical protein